MEKTDWDAVSIQKGVPIPPTERQKSSAAAEKIKQLQVGDSFTVPAKAQANVVLQFRAVHGKGSYVSRKSHDGATVTFWRKATD